jgi:hypothetical protein
MVFIMSHERSGEDPPAALPIPYDPIDLGLNIQDHDDLRIIKESQNDRLLADALLWERDVLVALRDETDPKRREEAFDIIRQNEEKILQRQAELRHFRGDANIL